MNLLLIVFGTSARRSLLITRYFTAQAAVNSRSDASVGFTNMISFYDVLFYVSFHTVCMNRFNILLIFDFKHFHRGNCVCLFSPESVIISGFIFSRAPRASTSLYVSQSVGPSEKLGGLGGPEGLSEPQ